MALDKKIDIISVKLDEHCKQNKEDSVELKENQKEVRESQREMLNKIEVLPDKMREQFAPKWVEKFVYWLMVALAGGFITLIVYLLQKHII